MGKQMEPLFEAIGKVYQSIRSGGISLTALKILHRLRIISVLHTFNFTLKDLGVRDGVLILNSLDEIGGPKVCQLNDFIVTLREIEEKELENLTFAKDMFPIATFREHFDSGMRFFAAFHDGVVISVNGVHTKYAHLTYIKMPAVRLPEGMTYLNCALTSPDFRSHGIGTLLRTFVLNRMWNEGYRSIFGAVFSDNLGALRWNTTNGFSFWGRISYFCCFGRDFWWKRLTRFGSGYKHLFDAARQESEHVMAEVAS